MGDQQPKVDEGSLTRLPVLVEEMETAIFVGF